MSDYDFVENFQTLKLISCFRKKVGAIDVFPITSGTSLLVNAPSVFEEMPTLINNIFLVGALPWEETFEPHLLYNIPNNEKRFDPVSSLCFPHKCRYGSRIIKSMRKFMQETLMKPVEEKLEFFSLYLPQIEKAPHFFCCRFLGHALTIPTIFHDLTVSELFENVQKGEMRVSDMCICIQSSFTNEEFFFSLIKWIFDCESVSRLSLSPYIDSFLDKNFASEELSQAKWPENHRMALRDMIDSIILKPIPEPGDNFLIDVLPFPKFSWGFPPYESIWNQSSVYCFGTFVNQVDMKAYVLIMASLCLEKTIILYSKSISTTTAIIRGFHYALWPLQWVASSISILPDVAKEAIESPTPMMIGLDRPVKDFSQDHVYIDIDNHKIYGSAPRIPKSFDLSERLGGYWSKCNKQKTAEDIKKILEMTHLFIKDLISPLRASIMTDYSSMDNVRSVFMKEIFLQLVPLDIRSFMNEMIDTQMMQFYIELQCQKISEQFSKN